jgi:hypothetical protein
MTSGLQTRPERSRPFAPVRSTRALSGNRGSAVRLPARTRTARSPSKTTWNAVYVGFYEHLLDQKEALFEDVLPRVQDNVIRDVWPLWEAFLPPEKLEVVRRLLRKARRDHLANPS